MSTAALLHSIRRWLVFACFLLSLVVAGVGLAAYAVDRYSGGQFLAGVGVLLAVATLFNALRLSVGTFTEPTDDRDDQHRDGRENDAGAPDAE